MACIHYRHRWGGFGQRLRRPPLRHSRVQRENRVHQPLGLRARNEHAGVDVETEAVELLDSGDVLQRFPVFPAHDPLLVALGEGCLERLVATEQQPARVGAQQMGFSTTPPAARVQSCHVTSTPAEAKISPATACACRRMFGGAFAKL